jgi:hypothetical protein
MVLMPWKDHTAHFKWLNGHKEHYTCISLIYWLECVYTDNIVHRGLHNFYQSRKDHQIHKSSQNSNISFLGGQLVDKLLPYHANS